MIVCRMVTDRALSADGNYSVDFQQPGDDCVICRELTLIYAWPSSFFADAQTSVGPTILTPRLIYPSNPHRTASAVSHTNPARHRLENTAAEPKSLMRPMSLCCSRVT